MSDVRTALTDLPSGMLVTDASGSLVLRRVRLRVVAGPDRGLEMMLDGGSVIIGSHADTDMVLRDPTVSRYHAEATLLAEGVRVRDLGSTNGTFVGPSKVESVVLNPGAELRVGRTRIELLAADMPAPEVPSERTRFGNLVGSSAEMRRLFGVLEKVASSDVPVLIEGESGVGKSEAARAIHDASSRAGSAFVVADVAAAQAEEMVVAAFEAAAGGTLVLDRVDEASAPVAAALVSALERRERRELDVRPIAMSRSDLRAQVEAGTVRRDLYFHLAAVRVVIPPLRDRKEDLPVLVREIVHALGYEGVLLSPAELAPLQANPFPGNVRELRRLIEQTLLTSSMPRPSTPPHGQSPWSGGVTEELSAMPFKEAKERLVDAFERQYVADLLARHEGNLSRAASEAALDRNYLARLAKKHGLR